MLLDGATHNIGAIRSKKLSLVCVEPAIGEMQIEVSNKSPDECVSEGRPGTGVMETCLVTTLLQLSVFSI